MTEFLWTAADAAAATGGATTGGWLASGVSIDTRSLTKGDLFVALTDQRDGHDFVASAFAAGASAALVSRDVADVGGPLLLVDDVLPALEALGIAARARCQAVRVAVTGSVGKTSVKEMLAQIFRAAGSAHWSVKSFNNHWGVPLTLARLPQNTERAVFEIGMSTPGEIAPRSDMVRPHCAIITKIAGVHLEGLGSVAGVAEEKAGIFSGLESGGVAILPAQSDFLDLLRTRALEAASDAELLTFGTAAGSDGRVLSYSAEGHGALADLDILGSRVSVKLAAGGAHWALNAAAALLASVASAKLSAREAAEALSGFVPPAGRGGVEELPLRGGGTFTLVDDSYNANPTSMAAALQTLGTRPATRRLVVLGAMGELGPDSAKMHAALAGDVDASGARHVWLAGEDMKSLARELPESFEQHWASKAQDLLEHVQNALCHGDVLLIKGSNASGMVQFADALRQWSARTDEQMLERGVEHAAKGL
jgi:UDP-N-acetylmuramoyl-tripeptide--D-alanyl-D-alanine ligase